MGKRVVGGLAHFSALKSIDHASKRATKEASVHFNKDSKLLTELTQQIIKGINLNERIKTVDISLLTQPQPGTVSRSSTPQF